MTKEKIEEAEATEVKKAPDPIIEATVVVQNWEEERLETDVPQKVAAAREFLAAEHKKNLQNAGKSFKKLIESAPDSRITGIALATYSAGLMQPHSDIGFKFKEAVKNLTNEKAGNLASALVQRGIVQTKQPEPDK